jgi:hypothetical protein
MPPTLRCDSEASVDFKLPPDSVRPKTSANPTGAKDEK